LGATPRRRASARDEALAGVVDDGAFAAEDGVVGEGVAASSGGWPSGSGGCGGVADGWKVRDRLLTRLLVGRLDVLRDVVRRD